MSLLSVLVGFAFAHPFFLGPESSDEEWSDDDEFIRSKTISLHSDLRIIEEVLFPFFCLSFFFFFFFFFSFFLFFFFFFFRWKVSKNLLLPLRFDFLMIICPLLILLTYNFFTDFFSKKKIKSCCSTTPSIDPKPTHPQT